MQNDTRSGMAKPPTLKVGDLFVHCLRPKHVPYSVGAGAISASKRSAISVRCIPAAVKL